MPKQSRLHANKNRNAKWRMPFEPKKSAPSGTNSDPLLSTKEAARYLNLKPSTLEKWRSQGRGPEAVVLGTRTVRYRQSALDAFAQGGGNV